MSSPRDLHTVKETASASVSRIRLLVSRRRSQRCSSSWAYVVDNICPLCGAEVYVALAPRRA